MGDIENNAAKMVQAAWQARDEGSMLVVFPELSLTGYCPGDLLDSRPSSSVSRPASARCAPPRGRCAACAGCSARRCHSGAQASSYCNMLLVLRDGEIVLRYAKQLLPTYNTSSTNAATSGPARTWPGVTHRHRPGRADDLRRRLERHRRRLRRQPLRAPARRRANLVVSINASPSQVGKRELRHQIFGDASPSPWPAHPVREPDRRPRPAGLRRRFVRRRARKRRGLQAQRFSEDVTTLVFDGSFAARRPCAGAGQPRGLSTMASTARRSRSGLQDYARRCGFRQVVVGSSGGIDSALTLALAADAGGRRTCWR